ncbi:P-loop containing nucleoside triphosphate hydrolase protein [Cadophora sp. DSE1049]|nr:P-loop containing nucleoside triphosphate hydrolase protein [Cadophora sp. DSE1049]
MSGDIDSAFAHRFDTLTHSTATREFFATWLRVDPANLAAALTIGSTMLRGATFVRDMVMRLYHAFTQFLTASISIPAYDDLNKDILNWIGAHVLESQSPRNLAARTEDVGNMFTYFSKRKDLSFGKKTPINYLPAFGTVWFVHDRNIFLVHRIYYKEFQSKLPQEYVEAPTGDEPLVIMVFGRSIEPIRRFLEAVRDFADEERKANVTVRVSKHASNYAYRGSSMKRPMRRLETVHFDETTKAELIADIELYLDPNTRHYYTARGIPYRRGYLLHGPPGTGKTSLCLALATYFRLELYLLHIPSVGEDSHLESLFKSLPHRCIVLLEDIDAVGMQRKSDVDEMEEEERREKAEKKKGKDNKEGHAEEKEEAPTSRVTLSGLLNVLDGVTSQEGRIVIMTSNFASKLDKALTRPGRIDRQVYLGNMSPGSAKLMFLRMYAPDSDAPPLTSLLDSEYLNKLATEFSTYIPEDTFTPAQLQGYLITHRNSATNAVKETKVWVEDQQRIRTEEEEPAKRLAVWKAAKKAEEKAAEAAKQDDEKKESTDDDLTAASISESEDSLTGTFHGRIPRGTADAVRNEEVTTEEGSWSGSTPSTHSSETDSPNDSQPNSSWKWAWKAKKEDAK